MDWLAAPNHATFVDLPVPQMQTFGQRIDALRAPSGFDYLRVGLSLAVIVWHSVVTSYGRETESYFWIHYRAVCGNILPMFFALSGFLVAGSWERTKKLPLFFGYRAVRLIPALTVEVVLSALLLGPILTVAPLSEYFSGSTFWCYFLNILGIPQYHLPGMFASNPFPDTVNATIWTLPFELECYLLLAILGILGLRGGPKPRAVLLGLFVAYIAWGTVELRRSAWQAGWPPGRVLVCAFVAGVLLHLYRARVPLSRGVFLAAAAIGLLLSSKASLALLSVPFVAYCTAYLGMQNPPKRTFLLRGDYSYGMYLFGFPLEQTFAYLFPEMRVWWAVASFGVGAGLLYAAFSWHYIEQPILRRRNEIIGAIAATAGRLLPRPRNS